MNLGTAPRLTILLYFKHAVVCPVLSLRARWRPVCRAMPCLPFIRREVFTIVCACPVLVFDFHIKHGVVLGQGWGGVVRC